jgi:hypothetical protein
MSDTDAIIQMRIEDCRALARRASRTEDRAFWEKAAQRWQRLADQYARRTAGPVRDAVLKVAGGSPEAA